MDKQLKIIASWLGTGSLNIFGPPFAGKDTQGRILADKLQGALISGGDILRHHHDPEKITQIMAAGGLIPSDFYLQLIVPFLSQPKFAQKPLLLDAVGRMPQEAQVVIEAATTSGHPLKAVILLKLPEAEVWHRFERSKIENDRGQRADDQQEVLNTRLKEFTEETMPTIEFYREKGMLIEIDGAQTREEVTAEIIQSLVNFAV